MIMRAHSRVGASSAARWLACPGSVRLSADVPERRTSRYAAEGTAAHALAERCLRLGDEPRDWIGVTLSADGFDFEVDAEMAAAVALFVDHVRGLLADMPGARLLIERRVTLDEDLGMFGTLDVAIIAKVIAFVIDYKHGAGVAVEAEEELDDGTVRANAQGAYYSTALWLEEGLDHVQQVWFQVVQPRAEHPDGPIRETMLNPDALARWGNELTNGARRALEDSDAPLAAGDHCRWCPVFATCAEAHRVAQEEALVAFEPVAQPDGEAKVRAALLDGAGIARVMDARGFVRSYLKAVERCAHEILAGDPQGVPGYKRVRGKGHRRWTDWEGARGMLEGYGFDRGDLEKSEPTPISPNQAEALFKGRGSRAERKAARDALVAYWERPTTEPRVVEESAKGEPLLPGEDGMVRGGTYDAVDDKEQWI